MTVELDKLGFSNHAMNVLAKGSFCRWGGGTWLVNLDDLTQWTESRLLELPGCGSKTVRAVQGMLRMRGLSLKEG